MRFYLFAFILVLFGAAVMTQEPFVFTFLYIFLGILIVDSFWKRQVGKKIKIKRNMQSHAFPEEAVKVSLDISNNSFFPLVWGRVNEGFPVGVSIRLFNTVISVGSKDKHNLSYEFKAQKRGIYEIGPLNLTNGDVMGFTADQTYQFASQPLIVYPKVYALAELGFPSISPLGNKKYHQPIFEDPTRPIGKRGYKPGDPLRRIDWKSSAMTGELQVKLFEPAIALETAVFLDLSLAGYPQKRYFDAVELAISIAASVANYVIELREQVGLFTNGEDPLGIDNKPQMVLPGKGYAQLMQILTTLARVQAHETRDLVHLIQEQIVNLTWGTTMVVITGDASQSLFDSLINAQRVGIQVVLVLVGEVESVQAIKAQAESLGIQVHHIMYTPDLQIWQER